GRGRGAEGPPPGRCRRREEGQARGTAPPRHAPPSGRSPGAWTAPAPAAGRGSSKLFEDQRTVRAAEPEGVRQRNADLHAALLVRYVVEVALDRKSTRLNSSH